MMSSFLVSASWHAIDEEWAESQSSRYRARYPHSKPPPKKRYIESMSLEENIVLKKKHFRPATQVDMMIYPRKKDANRWVKAAHILKITIYE